MRLGVSIRKQIGLFSMMAALVLFFAACQGSEQSGPASVHLTLKPAASKPGGAKTASAPAPAGITSVRVDVTGPEMTPISTQVPVNSDQEAVVQLDVPPGPVRRFLVTAFDTEGAPRYRGEQTADLVPGASVNLTIEMVSLDITPGPTIQISPHTAVVPKDGSQRFSVTGADPSQVQFEVTSTVGNDSEQVGSIATDGDYSPPATILTDGSTPIGNPIPVTVTAINSAAPTDRDSATVTLTTGSKLTFEKNQRVTPVTGSPSTESSSQKHLAFYNGKVYAVWADCPDGCLSIFFSETEDGINWTNPPMIVASNRSGVSDPSLAVSSDGNVYVAYVACAFCSIPTIELAIRPFSGGEFKPTTPPLHTGSFPQSPTVAVSADGIAFVAWSDSKPTTGSDIYFQRIPTDQESRPFKSDNGNIFALHPAISISNSGKVFLAWEDQRNQRQEIFAAVSVDGGENFSSEIQVSTSSSCCVASSPTLSAGTSGTAYVVWQDDRNSPESPFIFFNTLTIDSNKLIPGDDKPIGNAKDDLTDEQREPSIALDGTGGIYIAFFEIYSGFDLGGIFLAKSTDGGSTFTFSDHIDDGCTSSGCDPTLRNESFPSLAVDSAGRAFTIWTDGRSGFNQQFDVFFAKGE